MKTCTRCHQVKPEGDYYQNKNNSWCIACYRESTLNNYRSKKDEYKVRLKRWRKDNKDQFLETQREYRKNNPQIQKEWAVRYPEKYKAHNAVSNALRDRKINKPDRCETCGVASKKLQGHHWKGYEKKNWLIVKWLCQPCHERADHDL